MLVEGALALFVVLGVVTIVWGVKRFNFSATVLAIAFAITAASWLALLIFTISITVRTLVVPSA
jgi:hypothetical protein